MKTLPILLIFALINSCIELEISAPSFPDIARFFWVSDSVVTLTITYNMLGFCLASLIYGPLSESYGRRHIMLLGNAILTVGAVGCVIAPTMNWLLVSRFIQGLGAATSAVIVSAIIADVYSTQKATRLYGIMNATFSSLMAMAPIFGGFINQAVGWRGNYGSVAAISIIAWVLLFFGLPETNRDRSKLDLKKILTDYKTLCLSTTFLSASAIPSLLYGCYMAFVALAPFIYMQEFHLSILVYTLHQAAIVAVFAITSVLAGHISHIIGVKRSVYSGLVTCLLGAMLMLTATTPYLLTIYMSIFTYGSAILYPIIFARSIEIFPEIKGTASSAIMSMRYFLCSGLTGLASYLYDGTPLMLASVISGTVVLITLLTLSLKSVNYWHA